MPQLQVVAQGDGTRGEHWFLKTGGSPEDYYSMLETVHPDGRRDEGGMGGPALYPGRLLNLYTGRAGQGPLRVIVRASPQVQALRLQSGQGEQCEMLACAQDPAIGVNLFAVLLPWKGGISSMQGLDAGGEAVADIRLR